MTTMTQNSLMENLAKATLRHNSLDGLEVAHSLDLKLKGSILVDNKRANLGILISVAIPRSRSWRVAAPSSAAQPLSRPGKSARISS